MPTKFPMQDPLSTEIQSPMIAGIMESLHCVSDSLDLMVESLVKKEMSPVPGLDPEDPRRIYQVPDENRIWLNSPEPQFYINNSLVTSDSKQFTIDYVGGSITFYGEYRPEKSDTVSVSCDHIYSSKKAGVGSQIDITFSEAFINKEFTLVGGNAEIYTGTVDKTLAASFIVKELDTDYTVSAIGLDGKPYKATVHTGAYYGKYSLELNMFTAKIAVTTEPSASVTAQGPSATYEGTAEESGVATIIVPEAGEYTVKSTYKNVSSNTETVNVSEAEKTYPVTVKFITLTVTIDAGSTVTVKNGNTTLTETATDGSAKFWLPNTGSWNVSATLLDQDTSGSVECSAYQDYSLKLNYISEVLDENDWDKIHKVSASGEADSWWEVGDEKNIVLNGTVGRLSLSNLSISVFILGFNHNPELEGNNLTHFALGKISGKMVALCDSQYADYTTGTCFHMNSSDENSGGWNQSYMRKTILGNSGNPSSPPSNSLLAALPADLRAAMRSVNKYTNNTGDDDDSSGAVTATVDWLWPLAEFELYGSRSHANRYERNSQQQYDYFKAGNPKTFGKHNATGTVVWAWSRSPDYDHFDSFVIFSTDGTSDFDTASRSGGLFVGFAV